MTTRRESKQGSGVSLPDALLVLFVGLKLAGLIEWPWLWVTAPFWIPMAAAFVVSFLAAIRKEKR